MTAAVPHILVLVSVIAAVAPAARSQDAVNVDNLGSGSNGTGVLSGHTFVPSTFIRDPFVRTSFRTGLGFGLTPELDPPPVVIQGDTLSGLNGSLLFALMKFEYQHAIREWLSVRAGINVVGRLADETRPLLAQGVTLYSGFELGWLIRVFEGERTSISASLDISNAAMTDIYLKRFIEGIIADGGVADGNNLVETTPSLRGGGGVHAAYAISRLTGLTLSGVLQYGESMDRAEGETWYYALSAAVDFNLLDNGGPPLGFVAGIRTGTSPDLAGTEGETTQSFFGRIGYTGSREFAIGLDMAYDLVPVRNIPEKQGFSSGVVEIRLYF